MDSKQVLVHLIQLLLFEIAISDLISHIPHMPLFKQPRYLTAVIVNTTGLIVHHPGCIKIYDFFGISKVHHTD